MNQIIAPTMSPLGYLLISLATIPGALAGVGLPGTIYSYTCSDCKCNAVGSTTFANRFDSQLGICRPAGAGSIQAVGLSSKGNLWCQMYTDDNCNDNEQNVGIQSELDNTWGCTAQQHGAFRSYKCYNP